LNVNAQFAINQVHVTTLDDKAFVYENHTTCHLHTARTNTRTAVLDR
jgi:hypothetical protein